MNKIIIFALFAWLIIPVLLKAQSVVESRHNLSVGESGAARIGFGQEVCKYCHTPHTERPASPMWRLGESSGPNYILYNSSTLQAIPSQPDGSSILCLSCHDGTIAQGKQVGQNADVDFSAGIVTMPSGRGNLTTDLSDDHPISFHYTPALAATDGQLKDPSAISTPIHLENGKVQCISCHDPHKNPYTNFLVASNQFSDLCLRCHDRNYWPTSSHSTSGAAWNGSNTDPWSHIEFPYPTVSENACENCHDPHNSAGKPHLLKAATEEGNCLDCHSGSVATTDILTQTLKTYSHNVYGYNQVHDPNEAAMPAAPHAECQDCHNPHAVNASSAMAPAANGFLMGVQGIDRGGNAVSSITNAYELCYRCHADSPAKPNSPTSRQIEQDNVRLEFDLANPSFHPIEGAGVNADVPSLIAPLTESSIIYCTDCHASDGAGSPAGPHGSIYPRILKYRYETDDLTLESVTNYELCYSCHSQTSILGDNSFKGHSMHIREEKTPCNACHDPHGISGSQGNSSNNSHLINFDLSIVSPDKMGRLRFEDTGSNSGRCYLTCHGENHNPESY